MLAILTFLMNLFGDHDIHFNAQQWITAYPAPAYWSSIHESITNTIVKKIENTVACTFFYYEFPNAERRKLSARYYKLKGIDTKRT